MTIGEQAPHGPGLLKGKELATTFSFLRPNDLVWNYVVGNYLKGETPPPFDLLYWNGDSTNLPGPMYCWYLRHTYLQNKLRQAGQAHRVRREGRPRPHRDPGLHLRLARRPHRAVDRGLRSPTGLLKGKKRFVLGASGHIAGVINPPPRTSAATGPTTSCPPPPKAWFDTAPTNSPAAGGPTGPPGSRPTPASMVAAPKIYPAIASTRPSSRRPAATSKQKA